MPSLANNKVYFMEYARLSTNKEGKSKLLIEIKVFAGFISHFFCGLKGKMFIVWEFNL